jgi:invasion protein IalB
MPCVLPPEKSRHSSVARRACGRRVGAALCGAIACLFQASLTAAQTAPTQAPDTPTSPLSPAASSLSGATSPPWPSSAPVASQLAPAPAETVRRFADWELTCVKPAETNENSTSGANTVANGVNEKPPASDVARSACRVSQRLAVKGTSETVFMVSVLPAKQPGLEAAIISTPLGGYLAPGMELKIDNGRPGRLLYETCNQADCHGGFALCFAQQAIGPLAMRPLVMK